MIEPGLFSAEPYRKPPPPKPEKLSAGRRLTLRQAEKIVHGWHPLSDTAGTGNLKLAPEGTGTCGDCRFRRPAEGDSYPKCLFGEYVHTWRSYTGRTATQTVYPRVASSAATDCRKRWPACSDFQPQETDDV